VSTHEAASEGLAAQIASAFCFGRLRGTPFLDARGDLTAFLMDCSASVWLAAKTAIYMTTMWSGGRREAGQYR
jgi:hypothetical protein